MVVACRLYRELENNKSDTVQGVALKVMSCTIKLVIIDFLSRLCDSEH